MVQDLVRSLFILTMLIDSGCDGGHQFVARRISKRNRIGGSGIHIIVTNVVSVFWRQGLLLFLDTFVFGYILCSAFGALTRRQWVKVH